MKFLPKNPPRSYQVGPVTLNDCGSLHLAANEQVTLMTEAGGEYDIARKEWGYYATPSTNGRLARFGLRTALVVNRFSKLYVMLVESGYEASFETYLQDEHSRVVAWLDTDDAVATLIAHMDGKAASCAE